MCSLRTQNLPTIDALISALKLALRDVEGMVKNVKLLIGITNYDVLFEGVRREGLTGISEAKVLRFSANEEGKVCVYYKVCQCQDGWFPKPIEDNLNFQVMQELFRPLHREDGVALKVDLNGRPGREKGRRQHWLYKVTYASGSVVDVPVKCISLPFVFDQSRELHLDSINDNSRSQEFTGEYSKAFCRQIVLDNIRKLLEGRGDNTLIPVWGSFFDKLNNFVTGFDFESTLYVVACKHGGESIPSTNVTWNSGALTLNEYVGPCMFASAPVRNSKLRELLLEKRVGADNLQLLQQNATRSRRYDFR